MAKQAIIYSRFSPRPDADTSQSCEKQIERCTAYTQRMGYEVRHSLADKDISGGVLDRPGLRQAIDLLEEGWVLVVDTGDRLARDMLIELTIVSQIERAGATVEYADGSPGRSTPEGRLFRGILSAFSQYERERIRLRTKNGLRRKREAGEWQGKPPVGYRYDKDTKRLVENDDEQDTIKIIKNMSHFSASEIAEYLSNHKRTFRGKPWSVKTIRKILKS